MTNNQNNIQWEDCRWKVNYIYSKIPSVSWKRRLSETFEEQKQFSLKFVF